jgi:tetratricopeptide (TPR) repeat protein
MSGGGDALLHHNLGTSLAAAGRHGEAVIAFTRALDLKPDYHMAQWDRGRSYLYLGNYRRGWDGGALRRQAPLWLWLLERTDSPWYPSIRLFRPRAEGDWDYVFDSASVELMKLAKW